jgi:hypothetical protein
VGSNPTGPAPFWGQKPTVCNNDSILVGFSILCRDPNPRGKCLSSDQLSPQIRQLWENLDKFRKRLKSNAKKEKMEVCAVDIFRKHAVRKMSFVWFSHRKTKYNFRTKRELV